MENRETPVVLTVAGSDNYGGAGVEIDTKTIHSLGGYAFNAITALTAQNSTGVKAVFPTPKKIFNQLLESILSDIKVDAVKIGMLVNSDIISSIVDAIDKYRLKNIVLDTVLISSSGKSLIEPDSIDLMIEELFPRVNLITPNLPEVERLVGKQKSIEDMAKSLFKLKVKNVLIKGGHSRNRDATDYLIQKPLIIESFSSPKIKTTHTHGTGCLLSSAIAIHLAKGKNLSESVKLSKNFLFNSIKNSYKLKFKYHQKANRREPIQT